MRAPLADARDETRAAEIAGTRTRRRAPGGGAAWPSLGESV
ncbi:hypothetical protein BURPS668_1819 [Burkholderia pseudomallei 668]|nr:hypothetical protein BURPS668_1819 [Burkholderia pseudomallei 668]